MDNASCEKDQPGGTHKSCAKVVDEADRAHQVLPWQRGAHVGGRSVAVRGAGGRGGVQLQPAVRRGPAV